jgi:putative aldouronate transport system substrate-binding protein
MTTVRTLSPSMTFDARDPDTRSLDENRWVRTYKEKLGINLKNLWVAPDNISTLTKWNASIAARDVPDFALVSTDVYKLLYDAGLIVDMGQIFEDYATPELKSTLSPTDYQSLTLDGKLLGFPTGTIAYHGSTILFLRQDWLDRVKMGPPTTMDEVIAIARAFKKAQLGGPDTLGLMFSNIMNSSYIFEYGDGKLDGFFNGYGAYLNYWILKDDKLVYSNTLPEMKPALQALQGLYKEGLINKDIAVCTSAIATEYVASEKTGIFYSTAWQGGVSMQPVLNKTPEAKFINVFPPSTVKGKPYPIQVNSPRPMRTFVSVNCKTPEAAVKIANLSYDLKIKDYDYYAASPITGISYIKYTPWSDHFFPPDYYLRESAAIRDADLAGNTDPLGNNTDWLHRYEIYQNAKAGKAPGNNLISWGTNGAWTTLYDYFIKDLLLTDPFSGLPTDTMTLKGTLLSGALNTAMFEVITGADISVWDKAVADWKMNGGDKITEEVNAWYKLVNK